MASGSMPLCILFSHILTGPTPRVRPELTRLPGISRHGMSGGTDEWGAGGLVPPSHGGALRGAVFLSSSGVFSVPAVDPDRSWAAVEDP